jgi:adenylyltransferase/sulfurtransferase
LKSWSASDGIPVSLSSSELRRYARHLTLPDVGVDGQRRLKRARVLLVGAGGLGSPAALYLAAAGVGTIGVIDHDLVDLSNLQRQVLHGTGTIGELKTRSAERRIRDLNPEVRVERIEDRLTSSNALELVRRYDLILDGSDNFPTRYLVNDACVLTKRPYVYGSIFRFEGQVSIFAAADGPCYRCLYAEPPAVDLIPSCAESGVLGVLPGIIGTLQALEAIKWILGLGRSLVGRLVLFESLEFSFRELEVRRDPACIACGTNPTLDSLIDYEAFCGVHDHGHGGVEATVGEVSAALGQIDDHSGGEGQGGGPMLVDVREPWELEIARIDGSVHIPLSEIGDRLSEFDTQRPIVLYCHTGPRALAAAEILRAAGFSRARALAGGIDAWAREYDPEVLRY